jgi:hypothetical protein
MHRLWLGEIYVWAGQYRQVNVSKGGFMFAAAAQVPTLMNQFERGPLSEYTPCRFGERDERAAALAVVHAELILIHPVLLRLHFPDEVPASQCVRVPNSVPNPSIRRDMRGSDVDGDGRAGCRPSCCRYHSQRTGALRSESG